MPPATPRLMLITDGSAGEDQHDWTRRLEGVAEDLARQRAGGQGGTFGTDFPLAVQLREKRLDTATLLELAQRLAELFPEQLLLNGRWDLARAAGAVGVHLPSTGLPTSALRKLAGAPTGSGELLVGRSCHSLEEVTRAADEGADYALFGPIWPTPSKERFGRAQGLARLTSAARATSMPVLAVGGVTPERVGPAMQAGAYGVAAIRAWFEPAASERFLTALGQSLAARRECDPAVP